MCWSPKSKGANELVDGSQAPPTPLFLRFLLSVLPPHSSPVPRGKRRSGCNNPDIVFFISTLNRLAANTDSVARAKQVWSWDQTLFLTGDAARAFGHSQSEQSTKVESKPELVPGCRRRESLVWGWPTHRWMTGRYNPMKVCSSLARSPLGSLKTPSSKRGWPSWRRGLHSVSSPALLLQVAEEKRLPSPHSTRPLSLFSPQAASILQSRNHASLGGDWLRTAEKEEREGGERCDDAH